MRGVWSPGYQANRIGSALTLLSPDFSWSSWAHEWWVFGEVAASKKTGNSEDFVIHACVNAEMPKSWWKIHSFNVRCLDVPLMCFLGLFGSPPEYLHRRFWGPNCLWVSTHHGYSKLSGHHLVHSCNIAPSSLQQSSRMHALLPTLHQSACGSSAHLRRHLVTAACQNISKSYL